jgi:hypothetical protein
MTDSPRTDRENSRTFKMKNKPRFEPEFQTREKSIEDTLDKLPVEVLEIILGILRHRGV